MAVPAPILCMIHNFPAPYFNKSIVLELAPTNKKVEDIRKELHDVINNCFNTMEYLDKLYGSHNHSSIKYAMMLYRNVDRALIKSRAQFKLNLLVQSINFEASLFSNGTILDFGAAPGMFMQNYLQHSNIKDNLIIPITIQSNMRANLDDDADQYYKLIKDHTHAQKSYVPYNNNGVPLRGLLAPELFPTAFTQYDGNIFCSMCMDHVVKFITQNIQTIPPVRLLISDIGSCVQYSKDKCRPIVDIDYFYLPYILLDMADQIERSGATYYNHRIVIICKMQRFAYQMCHDETAYGKLGALMNRCNNSQRHLIISKPPGSRNSNSEMYAIIIPHSELNNTRWHNISPTPILQPNNMWHLKYGLENIEITIRQLINNTTQKRKQQHPQQHGGYQRHQLEHQNLLSALPLYNIGGGAGGNTTGYFGTSGNIHSMFM